MDIMRQIEFALMLQVLRTLDEQGNSTCEEKLIDGAIESLLGTTGVPESLSKKNLMGIIRRIKK